jgi:hypothetical protein
MFNEELTKLDNTIVSLYNKIKEFRLWRDDIKILERDKLFLNNLKWKKAKLLKELSKNIPHRNYDTAIIK